MSVIRSLVILAGWCVLPATLGCGGITSVDAPDLIDPANLESAAGAAALRVGALSRFARGYVLQVRASGILTDEFMDANASFRFDQRVIPGAAESYPFGPLSLARIDLLNAANALQRFSPTPATRIAELYGLIGLVETMLAENMCAPLPLARVEGGMAVSAPVLSRDALLRLAVAHADSGVSLVAGADAVMNLLQLARGRALLDLGDFDGAAAAVADVPQAYAYNVAYSATLTNQRNDLFASISTARSVTVADREGGNGIAFVSGRDRRVVTQLLGNSSSGIPVYIYSGNSSLGAPIALATGIEGVLVRAEAALRRNDITTWANLLNGLRQSAITPAILALTPDSTTTATPELRVSVHFRERALWLFATGHRHGDLRRLVNQYSRGVETVFPTGTYSGPGGGTYGTDAVFFPVNEDQNPDYTGCRERAP